MIIIKFLRFLTGYVSFTARGGFIERFVNLCTKNKIPLWNLKRREDYLKADTSVKGYKTIRESAKRSGVRVSMDGKHGLPFFIHSNRKRAGILLGMSFALLLVAFLSSMIWSIDVSGNVELTDEQILESFCEHGVKIGAFKKNTDCSETAYQVMRDLPQLSFASINIIGSRAEIVVSERSVKPEFPDETTPCNIISSENGEVLSIEANVGSTEVKIGDAVIKGDLLISGITENADGSSNFKTARGHIFARVNKIIDTRNSEFEFYTQNSEKHRYLLYILGVKIPLGLPVGSENKSSVTQNITNGKITLPVGIISEHSFELDEKTQLPDCYKSLYCAEKYAEEYRRICQNSEAILSHIVTAEELDGFASFSGELEIKKDIAASKAILVDIS